jgi:hypothetical protein
MERLVSSSGGRCFIASSASWGLIAAAAGPAVGRWRRRLPLRRLCTRVLVRPEGGSVPPLVGNALHAFFPFTMKVSDQRGCPWSWVQWQVGVPQRRWVRAREPERASGGMGKRRKRAYLGCRKREAASPRALYQSAMRIVIHAVTPRFQCCDELGNLHNLPPRHSQFPHGFTEQKRNSWSAAYGKAAQAAVCMWVTYFIR